MKRFGSVLKRSGAILGAALLLGAMGAATLAAEADKTDNAEQADDGKMKIGFVDFDRVIAKSTKIRDMVGGIETKAREYQDRIDRNRGALQRLAGDLAKQKSVLSEAEVVTRAEDIKQLSSETEDLEYQLEKLLRNSRRETLNPALEEAIEVVAKIGKDEGYDLILRGDMILFASRRIDLTDRVIEVLDAPADTATPAPGTKAAAIEE